MSVWVDANVLIRHLTGDPPTMARRAARFLSEAAPGDLRVADLVVAEVVYVLESVYGAGDPELLLRAVEVYETERLDFAEAYLVACAERSGVHRVASFDKTLRRARTVELVQP